jgi:hypothetical protein
MRWLVDDRPRRSAATVRAAARSAALPLLQLLKDERGELAHAAVPDEGGN